MTGPSVYELLVEYMLRSRRTTTLTITYAPRPDGDAAWRYNITSGNVQRDGDFRGASVFHPDHLLRQLAADLQWLRHGQDLRVARGDDVDDTEDVVSAEYAQPNLLED